MKSRRNKNMTISVLYNVLSHFLLVSNDHICNGSITKLRLLVQSTKEKKMYFGEVEYFKISTLHGFKYSMANVSYVFVLYVYYSQQT